MDNSKFELLSKGPNYEVVLLESVHIGSLLLYIKKHQLSARKKMELWDTLPAC